jgi:hypothetical protein
MNSFESLQNNTSEQKPEGRVEQAEKLEEAIIKAEIERLRNPQVSAYDNLKRFGKRAAAVGLIIATLLSGAPALAQTYRPSVETGSVETGRIKIESLESYKYKTPEIEDKIEKVRLAVDKILSRIGKEEGIYLTKLDVDIVMKLNEGLNNKNHPLDARINEKAMLLQIFIAKNFNLEDNQRALEMLLAHEMGHLIDEQKNQGVSKKENEAFKLARLENSEINKKLTALENEKRSIEKKEIPEIFKIREEIKRLGKKLVVEKLTEKEGHALRNLLETTEEKEEELMLDVKIKDKNYLNIIHEIDSLKDKIAEKMLPYMIKDGGPEAIADFFQVRWAVKNSWSAEEMKEAMEVLIGKSGSSSSELYGPTIQYRHKLMKFFYEQIQKNPKKYMGPLNDSETIHNYVTGLYKDFNLNNKTY